MTSTNQPENQKTQGGLSDLGQTTFTPYTYDGKRWVTIEKPWRHGVRTASFSEECEGDKAFFISLSAELEGDTLYRLSLILADLTSTKKDDREWGKKRVKDMAAEGKSVFEAARAVMESYAGEPQS